MACSRYGVRKSQQNSDSSASIIGVDKLAIRSYYNTMLNTNSEGNMQNITDIHYEATQAAKNAVSSFLADWN